MYQYNTLSITILIMHHHRNINNNLRINTYSMFIIVVSIVYSQAWASCQSYCSIVDAAEVNGLMDVVMPMHERE